MKISIASDHAAYNEKQNIIDCPIIDIGGGYGIFAEEMQKINSQSVMIIEPGPDLAEICRKYIRIHGIAGGKYYL